MSLEEMRTMEETFPAGLEQPAGSFRFSSDALLLADFALESSLPENAVFADLGTGCGVVALGVLRRRARWRGAGNSARTCRGGRAQRLGARPFGALSRGGGKRDGFLFPAQTQSRV